MPPPSPLTRFRKELRKRFDLIRKEPGQRKDHLDRFIKEGDVYVLNRLEKGEPKPTRAQFETLFKSFEQKDSEKDSETEAPGCEPDPNTRFLQLAEETLLAEDELAKRGAGYDLREKILMETAGTLAAAARAGTIPRLAGIRWAYRIGGEEQLLDVRRHIQIAANLLRAGSGAASRRT